MIDDNKCTDMAAKIDKEGIKWKVQSVERVVTQSHAECEASWSRMVGYYKRKFGFNLED